MVNGLIRFPELHDVIYVADINLKIFCTDPESIPEVFINNKQKIICAYQINFAVFIDEIATQLNTTFDEFISLMNEFENSDSSINETQSSNEEVNLTYNLLDRLCCKLTVLMTCNKFLLDIKLY